MSEDIPDDGEPQEDVFNLHHCPVCDDEIGQIPLSDDATAYCSEDCFVEAQL